jgi:regulator of sirC expression with transglutaminase-like and TPR domain
MSVRQPYAWLIVIGEKTVENRGRSTSHRGRLLIHSSSNRRDYESFKANNSDVSLHSSWLAFGAIVGCVDLVDVVEMTPALEANPWAFGPHCYLLKNPVWFPQPIPCTGNVGLFNLPPSLVPEIREQLANPPRRLSGIDDLLRLIRAQRIVENERYTETDRLWDRVDAAVKRDDLRKAKRLLDRLATGTPNVDVYRVRADVCWQLRECREALADVQEALRLDPRDADAHFLQGVFFEQMGWLKEAFSSYEQAVRLDGNNSDALYGRGKIRVALREYPGALQDFSRAIELDDEDPERYLRRAFLLDMLGNRGEADRDYAMAKSIAANQEEDTGDEDED